MNFIAQFHPRHFVESLAIIDREATEERRNLQSLVRTERIFIVFLVTLFCLLMVNYVKYSSAYFFTLKWLASTFGDNPSELILYLKQTQFFSLLSHAWWGLWHLIGYALIPMIVIKCVFKEPLSQFGWQLGDARKHLKWYVFLALPILCFVVIVSFRPDFKAHYPFYSYAFRSWVDFLGWELIYIVQFISLEFFFRGFIVNALKPYFGSTAVLVMCIPYLMIHFPKPWLEATGAIFFGLFLGVLALRSRSIWGGVGVHVAIAVSMDVAALLQTRGLPDTWWP